MEFGSKLNEHEYIYIFEKKMEIIILLKYVRQNMFGGVAQLCPFMIISVKMARPISFFFRRRCVTDIEAITERDSKTKCWVQVDPLMHLGVRDDVLTELVKGSAVMLVFLDLSSPFNIIDHDIMLDERMQEQIPNREFGISGSTHVLGENSERMSQKHGVPQGLVVGSSIFTAYAQPVASIITCFQFCMYQIYATIHSFMLALKASHWRSTSSCIRI